MRVMNDASTMPMTCSEDVFKIAIMVDQDLHRALTTVIEDFRKGQQFFANVVTMKFRLKSPKMLSFHDSLNIY